MKSCAVLGLVAALLPAARAAPGPDSVPEAIAVAEFTAPPVTPEDWTYGLADLLALELQRRGAVLLERRDIRWLLHERQRFYLTAESLESAPSLDLPELRALVSGTIRQTAPNRFHLLVSLTDPGAGTEILSADTTGDWPADVPNALASIATRLSSNLGARSVGPPPQRLSRFARTPEISWLFYRGIAHCLADEPEWGAVYFLEALRADRLFTAARVWNLRAFQLLGFGEFTQLAHAQLERTPDGREALRQIEHADWFPQHGSVLALVTAPDLSESAARTLAALRQTLEQSPDIFLFDPDRIAALAAEMDLQLTARFGEPAELTRLAWTAAPGILTAEPAGNRADAGLRLTYRQALTARPVWTREVDGATPTIESTAQAIQQLAQHQPPALESTAGVTTAPPISRPWKPQAYDFPPSRVDLANNFRHLRNHPTDRDAWRNLTRFVEWLDDAHVVAVLARLIALVDPAEPHASRTLSGLLWERRFKRQHIGPPWPPPLPLAEEFRPLLDQFPNSLAADYVRVMQAMESFEQREFAEAASRFLEMEPRLRSRAPPELIPLEYWACYYTYTAAALRACGRTAQARDWFARAEALFRKDPNLEPYQRVDGYGGRPNDPRFLEVWTNPFPAQHDTVGPFPTLRQAVVHALRESDSLPPGSLEALERLFREADAATGPDKIRLHRERVSWLIDYKTRHRQTFQTQLDPFDHRKGNRMVHLSLGSSQRACTAEEQLFLEAAASLNRLTRGTLLAHEFQSLQDLGRQLAQGVHPSLAAHALEAVGLYEDARGLLERHLAELEAHPDPSVPATPATPDDEYQRLHEERARPDTLAHLARLCQLLGQPGQAGDLLRQELEPPPFALFPLADQVASYWIQAGRIDDACELYRHLSTLPLRGSITENPQAIARLRLAECEMDRGNLFDATELLRNLARECDGTNWLSAGDRFFLLKDEVLHRLALARGLTGVRIQSRDWERVGLSTFVPPPPTCPETSAARELQAALIAEMFFLHSQAADEIVQRHGRAALPALLRSTETSLNLGPRLLDRLAQPLDTAQVLERFKHNPYLATTAFRLDPERAAQILRERFGIFAKGALVPIPLRIAIEQHRLQDQYPVLLANLWGDAWNAQSEIPALDRMLARDPSPELDRQFHDVLAYRLELHLATGRTEGLSDIARIAVRRGVPQGIAVLLGTPSEHQPQVLEFLRDYLDLPPAPEAAWRTLEETRGAWEWDPSGRRFRSSRPL